MPFDLLSTEKLHTFFSIFSHTMEEARKYLFKLLKDVLFCRRREVSYLVSRKKVGGGGGGGVCLLFKVGSRHTTALYHHSAIVQCKVRRILWNHIKDIGFDYGFLKVTVSLEYGTSGFGCFHI